MANSKINVLSAYELKEIFSLDDLTIKNIQLINLTNINSPIDESGLCPLYWLCINKKINIEILEHLKINTDANFDQYNEISLNVPPYKRIKISPLSALCGNPSFTFDMMILLGNCKFASTNYEKHKVCSPIFTLCGNPSVTLQMLNFLHNKGYDLYQHSLIVEGETSFDKLFANPSISNEIVQFIFANCELKILNTKSAITNLFQNPSINFEIVKYFNDCYHRVLADNFSAIIQNPKFADFNF